MPFFNLFAKKSCTMGADIYQQALAKAQQALPKRFAQPAQTEEERRLRFEVIALAVVAEMSKMEQRHHQALYDAMFDDFDAALREGGVGDLAVGKRIKKYASAFDGRYASYLPSLQKGKGGEKSLQQALVRNHVGTAAEVKSLVAIFHTA